MAQLGDAGRLSQPQQLLMEILTSDEDDLGDIITILERAEGMQQHRVNPLGSNLLPQIDRNPQQQSQPVTSAPTEAPPSSQPNDQPAKAQGTFELPSSRASPADTLGLQFGSFDINHLDRL